MSVKVTVDFSQGYQTVTWLRAYVGKQIVNMMNELGIDLQSWMRRELFGPYPSGTTNTTLSNRSGTLSKTIHPIKAELDGNIVRGGVTVGNAQTERYVGVHFGQQGASTQISGNPWLTIPLPSALNPHGIPQGRARDEAVFGKTFIARSRAGNLIIFGKLVYQRGKRAGQTKGDIVPLFVLKQSVNVKTRIWPEDIKRWVEPEIGKRLAAIRQGIESSTVRSEV